jgi:hypothetical protein
MPHQNRPNGRPGSVDDAAPAERDDVEARAAALQAQMAARRANQIDHGPPLSDNGAPDELHHDSRGNPVLADGHPVDSQAKLDVPRPLRRPPVTLASAV